MANIVWKDDVDGNFNIATNWTPGTVPGSVDSARITAVGSTYTVNSATSNVVSDVQTSAFATLAIASGTFTTTNGSGSGSNAGLIQIGNNTTFQAAGAVRNSGSIRLQSSGNTTTFEILAAGASLRAGGTVELSDSGANRIIGATATATLTNVNNLIQGGGQLGGGQMAFVNQSEGKVRATSASGLVLNTGAQAVLNSGLLEATTGTLTIQGTTVDNSTGGDILANGGNVNLQSARIIGGTLDSTGAGALQAVDRGSVLDGTTSTVHVDGTVNVLNNQYLTIGGEIDNGASINLLSSGNDTRLVIDAAGATLSGGGTVDLSNSSPNLIIGTSAGATLTNVNNLIRGGGQLGGGQLTFVNQIGGILRATMASGLVLNTGAQVVENSGRLEATTGTLTIQNTSVDGSSGGLIRGAGGTVSLQSARLVGGTLRTSGAGTIQAVDRGSLLDGSTSTVHNEGIVNVLNNQYLTIAGSINNTARINLLSAGNDTRLVIDAAGATLSGGGTVSLSNSSTNLIVGNSATAALTNVDNLIQGGGQLGGAQMTFVNQAGGIVRATMSNALVLNTGAKAVVNNGLLEATVGTLVIQSTTVDNSGGGDILANGGNVNLHSAAIVGGTLETSGSGVLQAIDRGSVLDGRSSAVLNLGTTNILNNQYLTLRGNIDFGSGTNVGRINLLSSGNDTRLIAGLGSTTLGATATVTMSDNSANSITGTLSPGATPKVSQLLNRGSITGAGTIGADMKLTNRGKISATLGNALIISTGNPAVAGSNVVTNKGVLEAINPGALPSTGGLRIIGSVITDPGSIVRATGSGTHVDLEGATIRGGRLVTAAGGVIQTFAGNRTSLLDGSSAVGAVNVDGTVNVTNDAYLTIAGTIDNTATINLTSVGNDTRLVVAAAGATLTGGGRVTLSDSSANTITGASATASLTNVNNLIEGGGQLGNGQMTLVNQVGGIVRATLSNGLVLNTGAQVVQNAGLLEATTGALTIQSTSVDGSSGGVIRGAGGKVNLHSAHIVGGTLQTSGPGAFQAVDRGSLLDGTAHTVHVDGTVNVLNNQYLTIAGNIDNTAGIHLLSVGNDTRLVIGNAGASLTGGGTVSLSDNPANLITGNSATATLSNVDNVIRGGGQLGGGQMTFANLAGGVVRATTANALVLNTGAQTVVNDGLIEATTGTLVIQNTKVEGSGGGDIRANAGNVNLQSAHIAGGTLGSSGGGAFQAVDRGSLLDGTASDVHVNAVVNVLNNQYLSVAGDIDNGGSINLLGVGNDTRLVVATSGARLLGGGTISLSDNSANAIIGNSATATLTNANNLIEGGGQLGGGSMRFVNQSGGIVDANAANALTIDTGTRAVDNRGRFEADAGSTLNVAGTLKNTGTLVADGTIFVAGAVTGNGAAVINDGGTLRFGAGSSAAVDFAEVTGLLQLDNSQGFTGTIAGLDPAVDGDYIDLEDINIAGASKSYSGNATSGVLTVTDGIRTANLKMIGNYTVASFALVNDGNGHVRITDPVMALFSQAMSATGVPGTGLMSTPSAPSNAWQPDILAAPV
ncbi:MAG: hypothetical protein KIS73_26760 [Enhydrobacter sp.]|nr:hypothetical protein [Enhydrobacter sp.]